MKVSLLLPSSSMYHTKLPMGNNFCHFNVQSLSIIKSLQSAHLMQHSLLNLINTVHCDGRDHWSKRRRDKVYQWCLFSSNRSVCQGGHTRKRSVVLTLCKWPHSSLCIYLSVNCELTFLLYPLSVWTLPVSIIMENCFLWPLSIYPNSPFFFFIL